MELNKNSPYRLLHTYNHLCDLGFADYLRCPDDGRIYIIVAENDPDMSHPHLHCFTCLSTVSIGLDTWDQIRAVVRDYGPDNLEKVEGL